MPDTENIYEEENRRRLIIENLRLVIYIAGKYGGTGAGTEDLISIGTIGLIKAVNSFDPGKKIKLATYASRCIENEMLLFLQCAEKKKREVSLDEPISAGSDGKKMFLSELLGTEEDPVSKCMEQKAEYELLWKAIDKLDKKERTLICLRYGIGTENGEEKTQKEIAELFQISQSYISRMEKKILKKLKAELEKMQ